jgi:hypothetical protein
VIRVIRVITLISLLENLKAGAEGGYWGRWRKRYAFYSKNRRRDIILRIENKSSSNYLKSRGAHASPPTTPQFLNASGLAGEVTDMLGDGSGSGY